MVSQRGVFVCTQLAAAKQPAAQASLEERRVVPVVADPYKRGSARPRNSEVCETPLNRCSKRPMSEEEVFTRSQNFGRGQQGRLCTAGAQAPNVGRGRRQEVIDRGRPHQCWRARNRAVCDALRCALNSAGFLQLPESKSNLHRSASISGHQLHAIIASDLESVGLSRALVEPSHLAACGPKFTGRRVRRADGS